MVCELSDLNTKTSFSVCQMIFDYIFNDRFDPYNLHIAQENQTG